MEGITLHDLADDIASVIRTLAGKPATLIGHDFGDRVARTVANDHSELVDRIISLAPAPPTHLSQLIDGSISSCWNLFIPREERIQQLREHLFSAQADPTIWLDGWHPEVARSQIDADTATLVEDWWQTTCPIRLLIGVEDKLFTKFDLKSDQKSSGATTSVRKLEHAKRVLVVECANLLPEEIANFAL